MRAILVGPRGRSRPPALGSRDPIDRGRRRVRHDSRRSPRRPRRRYHRLDADPRLGIGIRAGIEADGDRDRVFEEALTHRELEVLELLAEGLPNKGIADRLGISDQTVKFHIASIMGKLGASNRVETVRRAVRRGLLLALARAVTPPSERRCTCCRAPLRRIVNPLGTPIRSAVSTRCRSSTPVIGVWPNAMMMSPWREAGVTRRTARFH